MSSRFTGIDLELIDDSNEADLKDFKEGFYSTKHKVVIFYTHTPTADILDSLDSLEEQ